LDFFTAIGSRKSTRKGRFCEISLFQGGKKLGLAEAVNGRDKTMAINKYM
jgi:hypothetical protein